MAIYRERFQRLNNHKPSTKTNVPTMEITHARTIFTRFEDDLRLGGSGADPSSGGRVAVGIESVLVLVVSYILIHPVVPLLELTGRQ